MKKNDRKKRIKSKLPRHRCTASRVYIYILLRFSFADSTIFSMPENKNSLTNAKGEFVRNGKNILILFNSSSIFRI
jgi:hypothetical protein